MNFRRRKSRRARAVDRLRALDVGGRSKSIKRSGPAKTVKATGAAGRAAALSGKAMAVYTGRKAAGKRMPLLASAPLFAGASIASFLAVRKWRRGVKQTIPA
jgi:hypothetical protein